MSTKDRLAHLTESLPTVLAAAAAASWVTEVLVIDNGSTDGTAAWLSERANSHSCLRWAYDPVPGKSGALNRALLQLEGDAVLFTDDDVRVPRTWVGDMVAPMLSGEADAVSGSVVLADHLDRPWLSANLRARLAELRDVTGPVPGFVGANMGCRRGLATAIGFDEELGPGALGSADDVLFNLRIKAAGGRIVGCPGPPVVHHVDESRLCRDQMLGLAASQGRSHAYLWRHWLHSDLRWPVVYRLWAEARAARYRLLPGKEIDDSEYRAAFGVAFARAAAKERRRPPRYGPADAVSVASGGAPQPGVAPRVVCPASQEHC